MTSGEYLIGTEEGTISARSIRRFAVEAKRRDRELMDSVMGVPWDQGTTVGRPKRKQEAVLPPTPQIAPAEEEGEVQSKTPRLEVAEDTQVPETAEATGSGVVRPWHTTSGEAPMDVQISARRAWSGGGDERPEKKARVGGIFVGALYNPTEDIVVGEEEVEDVRMDSGDEENKPLSAEEIKEGDEEEFNKMDKYETYIPVAYEKGMVLDATWVRRRKPDGSVRCRYCCREFKRGDPRTDVFAVASSTSTSRIIDVM